MRCNARLGKSLEDRKLWQYGPRLSFSDVPDGDQEAWSSVANNLRNLGSNTLKFWAALHLFANSQHHQAVIVEQGGGWGKFDSASHDAYQLWSAWQFMAGRDGAMTIYHFGVALEATRQSLGLCSTMSAKIDHQRFRAAAKEFRTFFPTYEKMRHAVAHISDQSKSPNKRQEHEVRGDKSVPGLVSVSGNSTMTLTEGFNNQTFAMSWEGEFLTYDLAQASLDKLDEVRATIWSLFPRIE